MTRFNRILARLFLTTEERAAIIRRDIERAAQERLARFQQEQIARQQSKPSVAARKGWATRRGRAARV